MHEDVSCGVLTEKDGRKTRVGVGGLVVQKLLSLDYITLTAADLRLERGGCRENEREEHYKRRQSEKEIRRK